MTVFIQFAYFVKMCTRCAPQLKHAGNDHHLHK